VRSVRLLTNNPTKIESLRELGITVNAREPLVAPARAESSRYLRTKVERMGHTIDLALGHAANGAVRNGHAPVEHYPVSEIAARASGFCERAKRPFVTLCYAQSLDACLSSSPGKPLALSGPETLTLAHSLRASHDAVMVGIGTVLSDNPRLTVRHVAGRNPQPVVLDSRLRIPLDFSLLREPGRSVCVAAVRGYPAERRRAVEAAGGTVLTCAPNAEGRVDLADLLSRLARRGIRSVMVEGGVAVIRSLMASRLVDFLVVTIAPRFIGGEHGVRVQTELLEGPGMRNFHHLKIGDDLVLWGEPAWRA
jgi:3,4-dihydroxy 2-butanone 4-phosphate synthase/GTP cyclohydrolase II